MANMPSVYSMRQTAPAESKPWGHTIAFILQQDARPCPLVTSKTLLFPKSLISSKRRQKDLLSRKPTERDPLACGRVFGVRRLVAALSGAPSRSSSGAFDLRLQQPGEGDGMRIGPDFGHADLDRGFCQR